MSLSIHERFDWDFFVRRFQEAEALQNQLTTDVNGVENGTNILGGWEDLSSGEESSLWADLINDPNSAAAAKIQAITNDVENYMKSVVIQVEQPNNPGHYINLYVGTASMDGNGDINENFQDEQYDPWGDPTGPTPATLWEVINNPNLTLVNDLGDAYYDNPGGLGPGLATNWGNSSSLSFSQEWDGNGNDNGMYVAAQGTLAQWAPYIHYSGGDPSALNKDLNS